MDYFTGLRIQSLFILSFLLLLGCNQTQPEIQENPPMPGFDLAGSDSLAIELADSVMMKLGGRKNWDNTRYVQWSFFGRRLHVWDKWTGRLRLEYKDLTVLMNLNERSGRAWKADQEIVEPDSLEKKLDLAYRVWINDSFWMFMPYKLKDSGVTLKYAGKDTTSEGQDAEVVMLTFKDVGVTPGNKYKVYIDPESHLMTEWAYFVKAADPKPTLVNPWKNWQKYGNILLSDDRGHGRMHSDIAVYDSLPPAVFENPAAFK